jgi:hypothetical protein
LRIVQRIKERFARSVVVWMPAVMMHVNPMRVSADSGKP